MSKIFIVDDDLATQTLYERTFCQIGFEIIGKANNGMDAIEKFKNLHEKPDIIIMDYHMPLKNGVEAVKEILLIDDNIKTLFISGDSHIKEEVLCIKGSDFLEKPFKIVDLISKLKKLLDIAL